MKTFETFSGILKFRRASRNKRKTEILRISDISKIFEGFPVFSNFLLDFIDLVKNFEDFTFADIFKEFC